MATPLRKNEPEFEAGEIEQEEITTGDLARAKRPASETRGPQAVIEGNRGQNSTAIPSTADAVQASELQTSTSDAAKQRSVGSGASPLFPGNELESLRTRWKEIQTEFVDEPRKAVEQADTLVASAMKRLAEVFAEERSKLERQWDRGDNVSTEDLRVALQRYRTFFERLLSV